MAQAPQETADRGLLRRLAPTRALTRLVMVTERLWPLVLPLVLVAGLFLSLSWLGVFRLIPDWARLVVLAALALAAIAALVPLRYFRAPRADEIDRRIERANRLEHEPVRVQSDRLAATAQSPFAEALWREHQKRMANRLGSLASDMPRARVPERDPWGVRAAVALLFVVAFSFSYGPLGGTVTDAFRQHTSTPALAMRIDAWVTPPAYTGRAPLYLTADANREAPVFQVPAGSELAIRVTGGAGDESLLFLDAHSGDEQDVPASEPAAATQGGAQNLSRQFAGTLDADGLVTLSSAGEEIQRWAFNVIADNPPRITFVDEPTRALNGALELRYEVEDDYGVSAAFGEVRPAGQQAQDARPLYDAPELPLALPRRGSSDTASRTVSDLTDHPWAGSSVDVTLVATDAAEQEGRSETKSFILPERPFANPLARALVEQRRILALDANRKPHVLNLIDALTVRPEDTFDNMSHYLGLTVARTRLAMARSDDALREVADYLWEMALLIEDGALSDAERRLRQAQEALRQALEEGASDEELERLMAELRDAMRDFMRELAERAMQNPDQAMQMPPGGQELRQSDLERMLDQIEELARSGARDQAQDLLSQLQDMMNNLQAGRQQQQQQGQGQQGEMQQQMDELGRLMQRQQQMMNETFSLDQMQRGQQPQQGQNGQQMTPEEFAEAMRQLQEGQGQLQQDLQSLMESLEGMGMEPGEGFGDAGEAMGQAEGSLGEQQGERAVGEQGQALEALRRGAQDMMQQMQQAQGEEGQGQEGGRQNSADRDPLGRPRATTGPDFGNTVRVPDEVDVQRAREILEQIRRRLGNALSPQIEREYLERLLEMR